MALIDFKTTNMPYGMCRNEKGQWAIFNREYKPLGFYTDKGSVQDGHFDHLPIWLNYENFYLSNLKKIFPENGFKECRNGRLLVFFYGTPPEKGLYDKNQLKVYFKRLNKLFNKFIKPPKQKKCKHPYPVTAAGITVCHDCGSDL
jgi:hypothetical protein